MTLPSTPYTPGRHLGDLPEDPATLAEILRSNAKGIDTCLAAEYEQMLAAGIEPDVWRLAA